MSETETLSTPDSLPMENISLAPFLTFDGRSEEAMDFYQMIFPDAQRLSLIKIEDAQLGTIGKVLNGQMTIKGQLVMFMDMPPSQAVPFSWAMSLYVSCADEPEFDTIFAGLAKGGAVMMGPEPIMDLRKVSWVTDKFGVTWQLVWA